MIAKCERSLAFVLLLGYTCISGCKKPAPARPRVVDVRIVAKRPLVPMDSADLAARAAKAIGGASGLAVTDGGSGCDAPAQQLCWKLRVEVSGEAVVEHGRGVMRAIVAARLSPDGGGRDLEQQGVAEREIPISLQVSDGEWKAHVTRAVFDTVSAAGARLKLHYADPDAIVFAIGGPDSDLRDEAITTAGERRERAAVPALIRLLKSEDHDLRDQAIGALAQIGDPRAVKPLTEVARFRDLADLPKVLDALSAIGGDEARAYLEFVAAGHDNPAIRELAKQAIAHLDERTRRDLSTR